MPTAVRTPVSATLTPSRTAWLIGSPPPPPLERVGSRCCDRGGACAEDDVRGLVVRAEPPPVAAPDFRVALERAAAVPPVELFARCLAACARAPLDGELVPAERADAPREDEPPPRLSLRRPGRERGRFPSTPWSSLSFAATPEKYRSQRRRRADIVARSLRTAGILG